MSPVPIGQRRPGEVLRTVRDSPGGKLFELRGSTLPDRQILRRVRSSCVPGRGVAHYRKALAVAEARGMRPLVANCHLGLDREVDMRFWLEKAKAELRG